MLDSLDDLLASCHLVSRAIWLLTAEAKRRATLLRVCCTDYERSLDRLERLAAATRQLDQDVAVHAPESTRSRGHAEGGVRISSGHGEGDNSLGSTTLAPPRGSSLPESAIAANAAVRPGKSSPRYDCDGGISTLDGSSSITESLRQILEQARSIRTKEASSSRSGASAAGSERIVAAERSQTATSRPARESCRIASSGVKQAPVSAMPTLRAGRYASAANLVTAVPSTNASRRERATTCSTRSRHAKPDPVSAPARGGHAVTSAPPTFVTTGTTARSRAALTLVTAPSGASGCGHVELHSADVQAAGSEFVQVEHEGAASDALEHSNEVTSGLMDAILEESVRFMVARAGFARTHAGCGGIGNDPHSGVSAAEDALMLALESEPSRSKDSALNQRAWLDAHFAAWPEMLPRSSPSAREADRWRDMRRHLGAPLGPVSGRNHEGHGDPSAMGVGWLGNGGSGGWDDVEQLQRSLLMLLDEVEGGRQVADATERTGRRENTVQGSEGGERDHAGRDLPRRNLEDWYGCNKVAHVTALLRQCFANNERCGWDDQASLSKEAAALVENPSLALTTENPLSALRMREEGSTWQDSSQSLTWARGLSDTACSMLVKDLQTCALPCCPLQRNWPCCREVACEQTALSFGQQLRTTAILAAETDLSRLVVPSLARALYAGSRKERPSDGGYFRAECSQTQKASRRTFREAHFQGLKRLPQHSDECYGTNEDVVLWAPVLAVCRSVDAVVSGMGRPRMNFVRRRSNDCLAGAT